MAILWQKKKKKGEKRKRKKKKGEGEKEGKRKREGSKPDPSVAREIKRQLAQIKPGVQISSDLSCARLDFRETQDS